MRRFVTASMLVALALVTTSGSIAYAGLPPTVLWQDNFTGQATNTRLSDIGWSVIGTTQLLTSYTVENALSPPVSVRTYGMGVNAVFTLYQPVTGMDTRTSQWFHFLAHQANGNGTSLLDAARVTTSGSCVFYFLIAERQVMAVTESPGGVYDSGNLGDKLSDGAWHDFDIKYNNAAGNQTVSFYINNALVWSRVVANPGYINRVQFVQQGGAKPTTGENHLIGQMRIGTSDINCPTPPAAPTGIAASPATICSGESSTLSVNAPGAGLTTDWFSGSCGGTPAAGGAGVDSVVVSPTSTTTYYARTRNTADGCVSTTCQSVTVTIPNCDDGNVCTTDTCSNGTCIHTPIVPCNSNGFDPNWLFVIREGAYESQVRKLDESKLDLSPPDVYHMDLGAFGRVMSARGQDQSCAGKSICFTNSPRPSNSKVPGVDPSVTAAGARFFGVYEVNEMGEGNAGYATYSRTSFQIVELDASGRRTRVMQVGLAANVYADNPNEDHRNATSRDLLTAPHWGDDSQYEPWLWTRNTISACNPGTIRYNPAKNTIAVACVLGEFGIDQHDLGSITLHSNGEFTMGRDENSPDWLAYPRFRVYEFELPEWPVQYYQAGDMWESGDGTSEPIPAEWVGEPKPVSDPNLVRLVQIYELPGNIQAANGMNRNPYLRPSIDFDNDGNMYCTGLWYSARHEPCWGLYNDAYRWMGECADDYRGDVVKVNTLGHRAGRSIYHVPVTGAGAANLVVERVVEEALGHTHYFAPSGVVVRKAANELVVVMKNSCDCYFTHIYDLNSRVGGAYPNQLVLKKVLSGNLIDPGTGACPANVNPFIFGTPREPYYASYDEVSHRTYFANYFGDCGGVQNFMSLQPPPPVPPDPYTVVGDVGYFLTLPEGGTLNNDWDAASPPGPAIDQIGACCNTAAGTCTDNVSQTACYDAGGLWLGKGTLCGQYACPGQGACCKPCGQGCDIVYESQCTGWGRTWHGAGSACTETACETCSPQPMDNDCDGDVDQSDFAAFQACFAPGATPPAACACFDKAGVPESENAIDTFDLTVFELCASGPGVPGNGACAGVP